MWEFTVRLDADKSNVGAVSATYTDADETTFSHSARVQINVAGRNAFCAEALAGRNAWQARKLAEVPLVANIAARMLEVDV